MPYITEPSWLKWALRFALVGMYASLFALGALAMFEPVHHLWLSGAGLTAGSVLCLVGVITRMFRWEWVGIMPCIAALSSAVGMIVPSSDTIVTVLALTLALALAVRWTYLAKEDYRLRQPDRIDAVGERLEEIAG